ncbi:M20 aminoacylase family protein [Burkholderia sp. S171]|uniref:M20 aminoacylase family protein n=1 Tax=Burkholderia sp. S171 TaxID=1641860 RepID=UPI00131EAD93|nr:M20 aminoacylase family protein [Burkholderia sp. S171]
MNILSEIELNQKDMIAWRHDLHAHPEMAFKEYRTSDFVAGKLQEFGLEVHRGLAGTGVVGTLRLGSGSGRAIALRADMDALPIQEKNSFAHASVNPGVMHACGHDGHTTMLLGAARQLAKAGNFDGTVHFVFQPAEENEGGGRVMVEEGLFELFPVEAIYGMHNWPNLSTGEFVVHPGPMMAAVDLFEVKIVGQGAHAAMPHLGDDPIVASGAFITAVQTIVSRTADPLDSVVLSLTQIEGGNTWNIVPEEVRLTGTCRYFNPDVKPMVEKTLRRIADGVAKSHGVEIFIDYDHRCPPTVNAAGPVEFAALAATKVVGGDKVCRDMAPSMGCEDFAFMLAAKPGCYVWIGNGPGDGGCTLHNSHYDFNDEILPIGASYWCSLVETLLPATPIFGKVDHGKAR